MRKLIFNIFLTGLFLLVMPSARAFSLAGPIGNNDDNWQSIDLGYGYNDSVAPKDYKEGYRMVTPVVYYASDATYINYFGAGGLTNIDAAFAILNGVMCGQTNTPVMLATDTNGFYVTPNGYSTGLPVSLTQDKNLDNYSSDLSEFPFQSQQLNYTAQAASILDIKSTVLAEVLLELGLADPSRYVWTLHTRLSDPSVNTPKCPGDEQYLVVQRNYDINPYLNYPYSSYINGSLFTYQIMDFCGPGNNRPWTAMTMPYTADPSGSSDSTVTAGGLRGGGPSWGGYFTGLTRDDVAGLRYLMSSNTINWEATAVGGAQLVTTTVGAPQIITTMNLGSLIAASGTNNPTQLQAKFAGLVVVGLATNYSIGWVTNYTAFYTNYPGDPYGTAPTLISIPSVTLTLITNYVNAFANIVTNHYYATSLQSTMTVTVGNHPGWPAGSPLQTNINYTAPSVVNVPSGDFYVIPAGSAGYSNTPVAIANAVLYTNVIVSANSTSTNTGNSFTTPGYSYSQSTVTYGTNYSLMVYPLTIVKSTPATALRQGIGRVQFIRADYDSLLGQTFQHFTNSWNMVKIQNSQRVVETYSREVAAPDYLFSAQDLTQTSQQYPYGTIFTNPVPTFNQTGIQGNLAGPGTINPNGRNFTFNKNWNNALYLNGSMNNYNALGGTIYTTNFWLNGNSQGQFGTWGSYDESTNLPVVYPTSTQLSTILNQMIFQVSPSSLADGTNGAPYAPVTFAATGGQPPYVWSAPYLSTQVPGMTFNSATQRMSGTPTAAGTFPFSLQLSDSANRSVVFNFSIVIH